MGTNVTSFKYATGVQWSQITQACCSDLNKRSYITYHNYLFHTGPTWCCYSVSFNRLKFPLNRVYTIAFSFGPDRTCWMCCLPFSVRATEVNTPIVTVHCNNTLNSTIYDTIERIRSTGIVSWLAYFVVNSLFSRRVYEILLSRAVTFR